MSAISDFLFGSEGTPTSVVNTTPTALSNLSGPLAKLLDEVLRNPTTGTYTGPTVAPATPNEERLLGVLNNFALSDPESLRIARSALTGAATGAGQQGPLLQAPTLRAGQDLISQILTGATFNPATDKILQDSITAALRPLEARFEDEYRNMRGNFTAAGQFIQPGASSPFEFARGRLQRDLANAMSDTSARIMADNLIAERQRQGDLLDMQSRAADAEAQRRIDAAQLIPVLETTQLEGILTALEGNALPRLIQQLGLTEGREEFARQQEALLRVLELALRGAQPNAAVVPGSTGTGGLVQPIVNKVGEGLGNKASDVLTDIIFGGGDGEDQTSGGGGGLFETGMGALGDVWNWGTDTVGDLWGLGEDLFGGLFDWGDDWQGTSGGFGGEGVFDMGSPGYRSIYSDAKW